jgi:hypothetical protein
MCAMTNRSSGLYTALTAVSLVALSALAQPVAAQSLADAARRAEDARKQNAGRVYTNESLKPSDLPPAPPAEAGAAPAASAAQTPEAAKPAAPGIVMEEDAATGHTNVKAAAPPDQRDEQYWRNLFRDLRAKVAKAQAGIAAQEARLAEIEDDPSPTAAREREVIADMIARFQKSARVQSDEITRFLTRASMAKVPEEWTK